MIKPEQKSLPWWHERLIRSGYKMTTGRKVILDALANTPDYLSAEEVYTKIHPQYPRIGLTTIYRVLNLSAQLGLISKFAFGDSQARYRLAESFRTDSYHHLVCVNCHKVVEFTDFIEEEIKVLQGIKGDLARKYDYKIFNQVVQFYGLCDQCSSGIKTV